MTYMCVCMQIVTLYKVSYIGIPPILIYLVVKGDRESFLYYDIDITRCIKLSSS